MIDQNVLIKLVIHKKGVVGGRIHSHKWIDMLRSSDAPMWWTGIRFHALVHADSETHQEPLLFEFKKSSKILHTWAIDAAQAVSEHQNPQNTNEHRRTQWKIVEHRRTL